MDFISVANQVTRCFLYTKAEISGDSKGEGGGGGRPPAGSEFFSKSCLFPRNKHIVLGVHL